MSETFDDIESYFTGRCTDKEKQQFEDRCVTDEAFAERVAFYIQTREALKQELLNTKKAAWSAESGHRIGQTAASGDGHQKTIQEAANRPGRLRTLYGITAAAAAACILLFSLYLLTRPSGPSQLAAAYLHDHYDHLSQTLDGTRDSLANGITDYNNQKFTQALEIFTALAKTGQNETGHSGNSQNETGQNGNSQNENSRSGNNQNGNNTHTGNTDALLYTGLVYLRLKEYDQALRQFDTLAKITSLYSNPGPFLKAVTLLQRNAAGDREAARRLLNDVVNRQLDGSREAAAWLQKF